jgi:1,4-dihydroxy-2-naphthoyl-CoA synthase
MDEAKEWAAEVAKMSPTAIKFCKASFNADTDHQIGIQSLAMAGLESYVQTDEAKEGAAAFAEKRAPDFAKYVKK